MYLNKFLRTGNKGHRTGRLTGAGLVGRDHLDSVHLSAADPRQDTGAGGGVTSETLVTDYMVVYRSMDSLTKFPGHREAGASVGHHHGDIHRGRCWRSCRNIKNREMLIKPCKYPSGQSIEGAGAYAYSWLIFITYLLILKLFFNAILKRHILRSTLFLKSNTSFLFFNNFLRVVWLMYKLSSPSLPSTSQGKPLIL